MQSPSFDKIQKLLRQMTPHIQAAGFNNFVLLGYRRIPEHEREKYKGAAESPFYFYNFQRLEEAGAIVDWAADDIKKRVTQAAMRTPPPKEDKEDKEE
jgi:hypothetical protein